MQYILLLITGVLIAALLWHMLPRRRKLSPAMREWIKDAWRHAEQLSDPVRKVLEADKVLDQTLKAMGYEGSLADKMKKAAKYIPHLDRVWDAHRLRNRLAHEPGSHLTVTEAERAMDAFRTAVFKFL